MAKLASPMQSHLIKATAIVIIGILILLWVTPWLSVKWKLARLIYSSTYVAVYLDSNQTLYAKLRGLSPATMKLTDVYYLQSVTVGDSQTTNLVKRGTNEISNPENFLLVNRNHVLYWEAVGHDSQIMQFINASAK